MSVYKDKVLKGTTGKNAKQGLVQDQIEKIENWRKGFVEDGIKIPSFMNPYDEEDLKTLRKISEAIETMWQSHAIKLAGLRKELLSPIDIYGGHTNTVSSKRYSFRDKDKKLKKEYYSHNLVGANLYRRLKLVMDYWCALWFWPPEYADLLPERSEYHRDLLSLVYYTIKGDMVQLQDGLQDQLAVDDHVFTQPKDQLGLFAKEADQLGFDDMLSEVKKDMGKLEQGRVNEVNVDDLISDNPRLKVVSEVAEQMKFFHWELEFADIFKDRGGFDVILGNPPWLKVEWNEGDVIADFDPRYSVQNVSASTVAKDRDDLMLERKGLREAYIREYVETPLAVVPAVVPAIVPAIVPAKEHEAHKI